MFNGFPRPRKDGSGGSNIKSIQHYAGSMSGATTITIPITPVNTDNSIVISVANYGSNNGEGSQRTRVKFLDSGNVEVARYSDGGTTCYYSFAIIEYVKIKSKQSGDATLSSGSTTLAITTVDKTNALLICSYYTGSGSTSFYYELLSNSEIKFARAFNDGTHYINWQVIEL